jgi:hypothetical protein
MPGFIGFFSPRARDFARRAPLFFDSKLEFRGSASRLFFAVSRERCASERSFLWKCG